MKEFVHSDFGRTVPNVGTLLGEGLQCDIHTLDVLVSVSNHILVYVMMLPSCYCTRYVSRGSRVVDFETSSIKN